MAGAGAPGNHGSKIVPWGPSWSFLLVFLYTASGSWRQAESADDTAKIYLPPIQRGLQAPVLKWQRGGCFSSWCETGWYSSPAVANIDSDPQLEVIAGMYDLVAPDGETGALQWRTESSNRVWPSVAAVDLTGNGSLGIVSGRRFNGCL